MFIRGRTTRSRSTMRKGVWRYTDDGRQILDADAGAARERSL
jgi:hypothetical protein